MMNHQLAEQLNANVSATNTSGASVQWRQLRTHTHIHKGVKVQGLVQMKLFVCLCLAVVRPGVLVRSHIAGVLHQLLPALPTSALAALVEALLV